MYRKILDSTELVVLEQQDSNFQEDFLNTVLRDPRHWSVEHADRHLRIRSYVKSTTYVLNYNLSAITFLAVYNRLLAERL